MSVEIITSTLVRKASCPSNQNKKRIHDQKCRGLILEVRLSGTKTYFLRYKDPRGDYKQIKLGRAEHLKVSQARKLAQKFLGEVALGRDPQEDKKTLQDIPTFERFVRERYLPYVKTYKRSWETDESLLRIHLFPKFGKKHLDQITQAEIMTLHQDQLAAGAAPASANRLVILMRYIFNLALEWNIPGVQANPTKRIPLFEENNKRERYLTHEELKELSKAVRESENLMLKPIISMLILTGARKSEVLNARWEDIDLKRRLWRIPFTKSGKPRTVPLSNGAVAVLQEVPQVEGCQYIFANPDTGKPFNSIYRSWDTARKKAGLPDLRIHDLRHCFASFLINAGRTIYEVGELLGHTQIKTTMRYAHLANETLLEAVNTVPFDK